MSKAPTRSLCKTHRKSLAGRRKNCIVCGKEFIAWPYRLEIAKYCGQACRHTVVRQIDAAKIASLETRYPGAKFIPLTRGAYAIVDAAEYDALIGFTWQLATNGYATRNTSDRRGAYMHRQILNPPAGMHVDHVNGDKLDNRRCNIRVCTQSENLRNQKLSVRNSSGVKGVCYHKGGKKWAASIRTNHKTTHLGLFSTIEEAAQARRDAEVQQHGDFRRQA